MDLIEPTLEMLNKRIKALERALGRERQAKERAETLLENRARELFYTQEELQRQLSYLSNVLGSISDGIIIVSPDGHIRSVNDATMRLSGYSEEELLHEGIGKLIEFDDQSDNRARDIFSSDFPVHAEAYLITKNNRQRLVSISRAFVINESDEKAGVVISIRDVTEQKLAKFVWKNYQR